jgi:hypothetical protein
MWCRVLGLMALTACRAPYPQPERDAPANTVSVDIRNNSLLDAVVYAYRTGVRYRLGLVVANTTARLSLPLNFTEDGEAQLYVHRIGERSDADFLSNTVHVVSGLHPVLSVEPDVQASSLALFPDRP